VTVESSVPAQTGQPNLSALPSHERKFGRYTLLCRLATGGMANLYLARFLGPDGFEKLVAIKRIHEHLTENPEFVQMFIDEARLAARINHPNVAQVLELGTVGKSYFIAMEYVEGETLTSVLRLVKPQYPVGARILANAAAGLHAAHELRSSAGQLLQVVHRDVSPSNLLITYEGSVKVVDFGVARARGKMHSTAVGTVKGKLAYMAPEQAQHQEIDRRADIFALGIILYELTTWQRLFRADTEQETVAKVVECKIPPPSVMVDDYPSELEEIVLRALQKDPAKRYQTAQQMEQELEQFIVSSGTAVPPSAVGDLMISLFADRQQEKKEMIRTCADFAEIPELEPETDGSLSLAPQARRRWPAMLLGLLVLALVSIAAALVLKDRGRALDVKTPEATTIRITISVTPAGAKIVVGGKEVPNPYEARQPRGNGVAPVSVSAPGHISQRFGLPLAEGGSWVIALREEPTSMPVQVDAGAPVPKIKHTLKPKKKKKKDEPLFPNPYSK
jgi:eukaryotic-like serine/threonine-protein kinase